MVNLLVLLGLLAMPKALAQADGELPRLDIGVVLPLTGEQAPFGKEAQRGMELALTMFRQKDPKIGGLINLVTADSRSLLSEIEPAASRLLTKDRCQILLGGITSPEAELLANEAAKAKSALIVPIATSLSPSHGQVSTMLALGEAAQGKLLGRFAAQREFKAVAVLQDNENSSKVLAAQFTAQVKADGGSVVADETLDPSVSDQTATLRRLVELKAKAVLVATSVDKALSIMQQAQSAGLKLVFLGGELWDTPSLAQPMQQLGAEAFHLAAFAADDPAPETAAFVTAFEAQYKRKPGGIAALAYDATNLAIASYTHQPTAVRTQLLASLQATHEFAGVTGTLARDATAGTLNKSGIIKQPGKQGVRFVQRVTLP